MGTYRTSDADKIIVMALDDVSGTYREADVNKSILLESADGGLTWTPITSPSGTGAVVDFVELNDADVNLSTANLAADLIIVQITAPITAERTVTLPDVTTLTNTNGTSVRVVDRGGSLTAALNVIAVPFGAQTIGSGITAVPLMGSPAGAEFYYDPTNGATSWNLLSLVPFDADSVVDPEPSRIILVQGNVGDNLNTADTVLNAHANSISALEASDIVLADRIEVLTAGRLHSFGHSYGYETAHPYGALGSMPDGYPLGGDQGRYPKLLVDMLGVDISRRWLSKNFTAPGAVVGGTGTAAGGITAAIDVVPEDSIVEGVWYTPTNSITADATNYRRHALFIGKSPASFYGAYAHRAYNVFGATFATTETIMCLATGMVNNLTLPRTASGYAIPPVARAYVAPATGGTYVPNPLQWQSTVTGTGQIDPGGLITIRLANRYRNGGVTGSKITSSGLYAGGWASTFIRFPNRNYGVEVNLTAAYTSGGLSLTCSALAGTIPSGQKIAFWTGGALVTCTTTAAANFGATSIAISNAGANIAINSQGHARSATASGYSSLHPLGLHVLGWGINETDTDAYSEALRAVVANVSSPYYRSLEQGNVTTTNGTGTWSQYTPAAATQYGSPDQQEGMAAVRRLVGGTGSITYNIGPAYDGAPINLFYLAPAGASHGAQATITADGATPPQGAVTICTDNACLVDNLLQYGTDGTTKLAGTISNSAGGTPTLTLTSATGSFNVSTLDNLVGARGCRIRCTAGTGNIVADAKITSISSTTVAVLDGTGWPGGGGYNGTVTDIIIEGYVPMVKRITGLTAGEGHTLTTTVTAMSAVANSTPEFICLGYGIESASPTTPVAVVGTARVPGYPSLNTRVATLNTNAQAVIGGTHTNANGTNSTEPALPSSVIFVDIDTPLANDADNFEADGIHPNARGQQIIAKAIYEQARQSLTLEQLSTR